MEPNSFEIFKPEYRNSNCNPNVLKNRFEFCLKALEYSENESKELKIKIQELEEIIKDINIKLELSKNKKVINKKIKKESIMPIEQIKEVKTEVKQIKKSIYDD
jgi:chromosome segregation ATPase